MSARNDRRKALKSLAATLLLPSLASAQPSGAPIRIAMIEALSGAFANTGETVSPAGAQMPTTCRMVRPA